MSMIKPFLFSSVAIYSLMTNVVIANASPLSITTNPNAIEMYWTPERMRHATPMELPKASATRKLSLYELRAQNKNDKPEIIAKPAFPTVHIPPNQHQLFVPVPQKTQIQTVKPNDAGILNEQFSSSRLIPQSAETNYPYTTVGKLFFNTPAGPKTCSGSVVAKRLVLTAGHCVHNGNGTVSGYYTNFSFVPAYDKGSAQFFTWNTQIITVSHEWFSGGGTVPNAGDWALLVMADKTINGSTQSIGDVVGILGIKTQSAIPNHVHILGYPFNLDGGNLMHQVTSQSALAVYPNNVEYGSDMNLGSGGGPFVQNFGIASDGETGGSNPGRNLIIGLASYGYNDTVTLAEGTSVLNSSFTSYFNSVCNLKAGNC